MFGRLKVAIMGTGKIAGTMAETLKETKGVTCYAVGSRTLENAEKFARDYGFKKAYGSYAELVADPKVDLIYVATPHSEHYENVKLAKPFYNYEDEEKSQEDAIIYYEGTYIQNSGVDYGYENVFDVVSILDGTVISVEENDIVGTTVSIRHSNDLISVYQSLSDVIVKKDDKVIQGQIIAKRAM